MRGSTSEENATTAMVFGETHVGTTLKDLKLCPPFAPFVILTSSDPSNLKKLVGLEVYGVFTVDAIGDELPTIVARLARRDLLEAAATALDRGHTFNELLRRALICAFQQCPPIHTERHLASLVGTAPNRLSEALQDVRDVMGWHWPDVLEVIALWRVMCLLRARRTLKAVYEELSLSHSTMRRACAKHLNCKPSEILEHADRLAELIANLVATVITAGGRWKD